MGFNTTPPLDIPYQDNGEKAFADGEVQPSEQVSDNFLKKFVRNKSFSLVILKNCCLIIKIHIVEREPHTYCAYWNMVSFNVIDDVLAIRKNE